MAVQTQGRTIVDALREDLETKLFELQAAELYMNETLLRIAALLKRGDAAEALELTVEFKERSAEVSLAQASMLESMHRVKSALGIG